MFFEYWKTLPPGEHVHPADRYLVDKHRQIFELSIPPGHVNGRLKTAPIVACFLNPGIEGPDKEFLETEEGRGILFQQITGEHDFPIVIPRWDKWFFSRVQRIRLSKQELVKNVAIFNVCPYASQNAKLLSESFLKNLPSAQIARRYLHEVLIPQAQRRERFVVICRGARAWEAPRSLECDNIRFAYPRGGHFGADIANRISDWLVSRPVNGAQLRGEVHGVVTQEPRLEGQ